MSTYGNACATARSEAISELAKLLAKGQVKREQIDLLTEIFVATIHAMPPWSLKAIADRQQ